MYRLGDGSDIEVQAVVQIGGLFDVDDLAALTGAIISSTACQLGRYIGLIKTNLSECFNYQSRIYFHAGSQL